MQKKDELSILLAKYLKGKCTPEELQLLWKWMWQMDVAEGIALDKAEEEAIESGLHSKIISYARNHPAKSNTRVLVMRKGLVYAAVAAVFAILLTGSVIWLNSRGNNRDNTSDIAMVNIAADAKHIKKIMLPDSTEVVLNRNSSLTWLPGSYGTRIRKVVLNGEGYFEVHRDTAHPFIVQSGTILTQALGTKFNIEFYKGESEIKVSLLHGKVKVSDAAASQHFAILMPGKMVSYHTANQSLGLPMDIAVSDVTAWTKGDIVFNNTPLIDALSRLEKYYGINIIYNKEDVQNKLVAKPVTAVFTQANCSTVLSNILFAYGLKYTIRKDGVFINK